MDQLISAFGIDVNLIIIQIVNFAILAGFLWYFLYEPVLKMLNTREEKITQGIADAENAALALAKAEEEKAGILTKAHESAKEVANRAKTEADNSAAAILAEARKKAEVAVLEAKKEAELLQAKIKKETEAEITKTAILAAEKILREKTS